MNESRVFLSYSRHDQGFVDRLAHDLRKAGIEIWIDRENIEPGANWQAEIEGAISHASTLLYIITESSLRSAWMIAELTAATRRNLKVIPVLAGNVVTDALPPFVQNIQWIDFRTSYAEGISRLLRSFGVTGRKTTQRSQIKAAAQDVSKGYAFISYAEPDRDFAQPLKKFLKEHVYAYWDYEESDRDYHTQLFLELEGVIAEASATLCVLSETWKRSQWTVKEFFFSQEVGTPVFLIKAKPMGPSLAIAGMTFIDFTKGLDIGFERLDRELKRKGL
jgi:hypothetical protein